MMRTVGVVVVLSCLLAACGGGDDEGDKENPNSGGEEKDDGETLECGADSCTLPKELEGEELCCIDNFAGGCGIKVGASCRDIPDVDDRCPTPDIMVNFPGANSMTVFGCCTGNNQCGVDFGMGCQPRTVACAVIGPDQVDELVHETCDGEPLELPANCGMGGIRIPLP